MISTETRKFSAASSIGSAAHSSIYYTPTESPVCIIESAPLPRRCSFPKAHPQQFYNSHEIQVVGDENRQITASTMSLAGSYGSCVGGEILSEHDTMYKRFEALGQKWLSENHTRSNKYSQKSKNKRELSKEILTPMERVALKGFVSQRRSFRSRPIICPYKGVYHNLIPEIHIQDASNYDNEYPSQGFNPCTEECSEDNIDLYMNNIAEVIHMERPISQGDIHLPSQSGFDDDTLTSAVRSFYEEVKTFDYTIIEKCTHKNKEKSAPRLKIGMSPMALQRLFRTPRDRIKSSAMATVPEIPWSPNDTEYPKEFRSVLSGQCVQPMTPNCSIFHGKAMTTTAKLFRTLCLAYAYFIVGMCFSMLGPTLLDFSDHISISHGEAYQFLTVRGAGVAVGSVLLGTVIHVIDNYVSFAIVLSVCGLANVIFSTIHAFVVLILDEFVIGICLGFLETGTQILCVDIWGYDNTPFMLGIHFFYGIGTILGTIIAQPFLRKKPSMDNIIYNVSVTANTFDTNILSSNHTTMQTLYATSEFPTITTIPASNFKFAYFIVAGLFLSCGVLKMVIWMSNGKCTCTQQDKKYLKTHIQKRKVNDERTSLFMMTILFMFLHVGVESSYKGFLAPFTVTTLDWSRSHGAWVTSLTYTAYTFGRGIGMVTGNHLDPGFLLWLNLILMFSSLLTELIMVYKYPLVIWITAALQGLGQSTVLPACFMWASSRLDIKGISAGILMFTSSVGMMITPGITGWLMIYKSSKFFHIIPLGIVSLNILNFCMMSFLARKFTQNYDVTENTERSNDITESSKETVDENGNYIKETTTSTRLLDEVEKCTPTSFKSPIFDNLQIRSKFTGSPQTYKISNRSFGSDVISEIKSLESDEFYSCSVKKRKNKDSVSKTPFKSPGTLLKSPYSMNSYTPLALMTFGENNFGI